MSAPLAHAPPVRAGLGIPAGFALFKLALHLPVLQRYGFHHDELYFIACGEHLSFGYVDHAPLVPWIARLATTVAPESLFVLRLFPLLAGALAVFLAGALVRRLGGGGFAQVVACLAMLVPPVFLRTANMLCIPAFEPALWLAASYLIVRIVQEDEPRLWPLVGLVAGAGLMTKHSMLFFGFGLVFGLAVTPLRRHFRSPWLYLGGAVALALFLPNLLWQARHGWPTFVFLLNLNAKVMEDISTGQFLLGQLMYLHPLNVVVWGAGLWFLLVRPEGRAYRILAWIFVAVLALLLVLKSKIYYLAPAYPALIAAGALAIEQFVERRARPWLRPAFVAVWVVGGAAMAPASLPLLPIEATDAYVHAATLGALGNPYELTGDLHGMFGWRERVDAVADVYDSLDEDEKPRTVLLTGGYGNAGAVDLFGRDLGLPRAVSWDQTYWLWGYPEGEVDTYIGVGLSLKFLEQVFEETEIARSVELEHVNPWDTPFLVTINRNPKITLDEVWPQVRPW